jgi:Hydrogenase maturation factor
MSTKTIADFSCPAPLVIKDTVLLGHGSGGKLSAELIHDIFLPAFHNPILANLDDQAVVNIGGQRVAIAPIHLLCIRVFSRAATSDHWRCMAR